MSGKVVVTEFMTIDGVIQDPGGSGEYDRGGWSFEYDRGEEGDKFKLDELKTADAQLLGRITYEGFAKAWPTMKDDAGFADRMNGMPKYVVSTKRREFPWNNTHHVGGDLTRAVKALKKATPRGLLVGSPKLSAALQRLDLVDEYRFVVHPVVAGHGPFLFSGLKPSLHLNFVAAKRLKSGIVALHYGRR